MANTWIEPPPPQRGMGCFAKGCLILVVFSFLLIVACCAGLYWGYHHHSALFRGGYWLTKTRAISESPIDVPSYQTSEAQTQTVKERWETFETASEQRQPAEIELTASDINDLIAGSRHLRNRLFVSVDGNRLRMQASIPLREYIPQYGYYFNADITVQVEGPQSLDRPRLSAITVNGKRLPSDLLDWEYKSRRLRDYLAQYEDRSSDGSFEIRDSKVILRSRAR
jgi:hypothetical protein